MKTFSDGTSEDQTIWLLGHAVVLTLVGTLLVLAIPVHWRYSRIGDNTVIVASIGRILDVCTGISLVIVSIIRLRHPFQQLHMKFNMQGLVFTELLIGFVLGSVIMMVPADTGLFFFVLFMSSNLYILGFKIL